MKTPTDRPSKDEQLSRLIKLKAQERPDAKFWETFDQNLRSRQLSALVQTQTWYQRSWKLVSILARKSAPAVATASAFTLAFVAVNQTGLLVEDSTAPASEAVIADAESSDPLFVVESNLDAISESVVETIQANQVYTVQALTRSVSNDRYQLRASPQSFTAPRFSNEPSAAGAKVIRSDGQL